MDDEVSGQQEARFLEIWYYHSILRVLHREEDKPVKSWGKREQRNHLLCDMFLRKLSYFGHVIRHSCLEKNIFEAMVEGRRAQQQDGLMTSQSSLVRTSCATRITSISAIGGELSSGPKHQELSWLSQIVTISNKHIQMELKRKVHYLNKWEQQKILSKL